MKQLLGLATLLLLSVVGHAAPANITLVQNGTAKVAIYVTPEIMAPDDKKIHYTRPEYPAEVARLRLQASVNDLALYLGKISGAKVDVLTTPRATADKRLPIYIGA